MNECTLFPFLAVHGGKLSLKAITLSRFGVGFRLYLNIDQ